MCSISGFIALDGSNAEGRVRSRRLGEIVTAAEKRGRDSAGVVGITPEAKIRSEFRVGAPSTLVAETDSLSFLDESGSGRRATTDVPVNVAINNNRAEPTTEYVEAKDGTEDVQPFADADGRYWVSHNGTIANDEELAEAYGVEDQLTTDIDTAVLPALLAAKYPDEGFSLEELRTTLQDEVVGSYAVAVIDQERPDRLFLATNYKPLHLTYDTEEGAVYFSTFPDYLGEEQSPDQLFETESRTEQLDTYRAAELTTAGTIETLPIDPTRTPVDSPGTDPAATDSDAERALVIASGGLDSTTVAKQMMDGGYDVTLLHFTYRHRAESSELAAVKRIADRLSVPYDVVDTDVFAEVIGGSKLTDTGPEAEETAEGEAGAEFAIEWVPARNLIMLAIATGYAEAHGFDVLALGNNLEEAGAYPDNEMEFINRYADVLPYATAAEKDVRVEMPVGHLMKHEIVGLGLGNDAPLDLTWSCYDDGELHCGDCGPCFMRKTAFEIHGADEVIEYESDPETDVDPAAVAVEPNDD